ncbi:MAG: nucleoid-associated protein [Sphingobacteriales bacterium]|nr:MAG: nucleoid-associated protein [Sphingobacteriales bacterium]
MPAINAGDCPYFRGLMILITDAKLQGLTTHFIGNKASGETLTLSKEPVELENQELKQVLLHYFLSSFQQAEAYNFWHPSDLKLNEVRHYAEAIFEEPEDLLMHSISIARNLFDATDLPNIKSGELHVAYFKDIQVDQFITDAIGIYKSESKDTFLKITETGKSFHFEADQGVNPNKLDKACLILNIEEELGYRVMVIDKTNKGGEAQFWKDNFLKVRAASDDYHATADYLSMYKEYVVDQVPGEFEVTRVEQIDLLNKSVNYFKKNEQFSRQQFEEEVLQIPEVIESFRKYEQQYTGERDLRFEDEFDISGQAVKKQSRIFKSVLKLDKNFHVYIHGDKDLIEKGYDAAMGMNYYKIYFEEET